MQQELINHANIYLVNSFFQLTATVLISKNKKNNIIVSMNKKTYESAKNLVNASHFLCEFKRYPLIERRLSTRNHLNQIFNNLDKFDSASFYMPSLSGGRFNYFIHKATTFFGNNVDFNIIPDGTINLATYPLSESKRKRILKRSKSILDRLFGLRYTPFDNDKFGILSEHIKSIYIFKGIPNEYPKNKTIALPAFNKPVKGKSKKSKILIIGENLSSITNAKSIKILEDKIDNYFKVNKFNHIDYIPHPAVRNSDLRKDLLISNANILEIKDPIETFLIKETYSLVVGVCSTALLTSKIIYGDNAKVISFTPDKVNDEFTKMLEQTNLAFKQVGVEIIT